MSDQIKVVASGGKKKIAIIDLLFHWPPRGGSWVDLKEVASRWVAAGFEVRLFVPNFTKFFPRGKVDGTLPFKITKLPFTFTSFNSKNVPQEFRKCIDEFSPDIVFIGDGYFLKPHIIKALNGYPIILRFYGYELICPRMNFFNPLVDGFCNNTFLKNREYCIKCFTYSHRYLKFAIKSVLGIGCKVSSHFEHEFIFSSAYSDEYYRLLTDALKQVSDIVVYNKRMKEYLTPYNDNVHIIPSGVDTDRFVQTDLPNGSKTKLLFSGRATDPMKGLSIVIKEMCSVYDKRQDFELGVTGEKPMEFEQGYIKYAGWLSQEELPAMYKEYDIGIAPSLWDEPFGITPLEAMASGRPVLAAKRGGLASTVKDGETGYLFDPDREGDFADKLLKLLDSAQLRDKMGLLGRKRVEEEYSWAIIMEKYYMPMLAKYL